MWQLTHDTWHITHDTWQVICGSRWTFCKNCSLSALMIWELQMTWDTWHLTCDIQALPYCKMWRHIQTTGPFKQWNQKSWQKSFIWTILVLFWKLMHTFGKQIWNYKRKSYISSLDFFLLNLSMKKGWTKSSKSTQVWVRKKLYFPMSNFLKMATKGHGGDRRI